MSAKRDIQRQSLWKSWMSLDDTIKEVAELRAYELFENLKRAACEALTSSAARFSRLGTSDENTYSRLVALMETYQQIIDSAGIMNHKGPTVILLLSGICEVLASRLKEFEDATGEHNGKNPITLEKQIITDQATAYISEQIDRLSKNLTSRLNAKHYTTLNPSVYIEKIMQQEILPQAHVIFQEGLRICLASLNDLHSRKAAGLYTELIKREWEELGNIIKVQVLAVESATTETDASEDADALPAVYRILDMLREAYQHMGPTIGEFQKLFNSAPLPEPEITYDEFAQDMNNAITLTAPENFATHDFFILLKNEAIALFDQGQLTKTAYQIQKTTSDEKFLAEGIKKAFVDLYGLLHTQAQPAPINAEDPELALQHNIITGITETIEIKIESLADSFQTFDEDEQNLLRSFSEEKIMISDEDRNRIENDLCLAWLESPPTTESDITEFFASFAGNETLAALNGRIQKKIDNYLARTEKLTFRFKKEVLLYEICTYEEILTHSVSRLRASSSAEIRAISNLLDAAYTNLEILLKKNNIMPIRPATHEMFNAFLHDALVAEKHEDFAKGEIIKILNTGYMQKEKVILRANVIAAR